MTGAGMVDGVSVVICSYNGAGRLQPTLEHLLRQAVPVHLAWEVLLVDNASTDGTSAAARALWPADAPAPLRVVREEQSGLSHARQRGLQEARYCFVSFLDDDNWASSNWVERVYQVMTAHPEVGACGGRLNAVFEAQPPHWFARFANRIAVGEQSAQSGYLADGYALWGAGLTLRKSAWERLVGSGFQPLLIDRKGSQLSAGGDSELCLALALNGWKLWYDQNLSLEHFMPAPRLTWANFSRIARGSGASRVILQMYVIALIGYWSKKIRKQDSLGGQRRQLLREMLRAPLPFVSALLLRGEGSEEVLRMHEKIGAFLYLLRHGKEYQQAKTLIQSARWNLHRDGMTEKRP